MRLEALAETFGQLEEIRSRLRLIEVTGELLHHASPAERAPIVYLLQGQLRPPYEGVQIGLGEKLIGRAVASAFGTTAAAVTRRLKRTGDLGLVAAALAHPGGRRHSVLRTYRLLLRIARTTGPGSLTTKTDSLADALRAAGPLEAKFLVRMAQGRLRLGVGDQTILEAAALAALGSRTKKPLLEHAYNLHPDLGSLVRLAFERGGRGLSHLTPTIGVPVRPALAQRLPSAAAIIRRLGRVQAEPKYDGFRLQFHRDGAEVWAFSRRLENVTAMFPELAAGIRRQVRARRVILEGEAVVHNPETGEFLPFQTTMTRKRKTRIAEAADRYPLRLFAFDLLLAGNRNYVPRPQRERSRRLRQLVPFGPDDPIAVTDTFVTDRPRRLESYFADMINHGLEGVVAKRPSAPYRAGARGYDWVKLKRAYQSKLRDTVDLVLVGYQRGRGKRAALGIGSLLAAVYDPKRDRFRTVAKIGSGLTERAWRDLRATLDRTARSTRPRRVDSLITPDVWVEPKYVVEVLADEITRSPTHTCGRTGTRPGYALRFPRIVRGVRSDKGPTDATTEREILDLHRRQRRTRDKAASAKLH